MARNSSRYSYFDSAVALILDPQRRSAFLEKAFVGFFCLLLALSIYTLASDSFWLRFLSEYSDGLKAIASVKNEDGSSRRKTSIDTLWLPLVQNASIYDGDAVATRARSTVEIELNPTLSLTISPKSFIRIRLVDGKPLIQLKEGHIKTTASEDQSLLFQTGSKIEEMEIKTGESEIAIDSKTGTPIALSQSEKAAPGELEEKASEPTPAAASLQAEEAQPKGAQSATVQLPTPAASTIFLLTAPHEILIASHVACPDQCEMRVLRDQDLVFAKAFSKGESSIAKLPPEDALPGHYSWTFFSQAGEQTFDFQILPFSNETLSRALTTGRPVEVR